MRAISASSSGNVDFVEMLNGINFDLAEKIAGKQTLRQYFISFIEFYASDSILISDRLPIYLDSLVGKLEDARPHVKLMGYLIALSLIKKSSGKPQIEMARRFMDVMGLDKLPNIDDLSQDHLTRGKFLFRNPLHRSLISRF
jgi:U3 small nucleolar RNA-associated protein 10